MIFFGIIGLLLISYALWIKDEIQQDVFFIMGGISLLIHSFMIESVIFIILQIVFVLSAFAELVKLEKEEEKK